MNIKTIGKCVIIIILGMLIVKILIGCKNVEGNNPLPDGSACLIATDCGSGSHCEAGVCVSLQCKGNKTDQCSSIDGNTYLNTPLTIDNYNTLLNLDLATGLCGSVACPNVGCKNYYTSNGRQCKVGGIQSLTNPDFTTLDNLNPIADVPKNIYYPECVEDTQSICIVPESDSLQADLPKFDEDGICLPNQPEIMGFIEEYLSEAQGEAETQRICNLAATAAIANGTPVTPCHQADSDNLDCNSIIEDHWSICSNRNKATCGPLSNDSQPRTPGSFNENDWSTGLGFSGCKWVDSYLLTGDENPNAEVDISVLLSEDESRTEYESGDEYPNADKCKCDTTVGTKRKVQAANPDDEYLDADSDYRDSQGLKECAMSMTDGDWCGGPEYSDQESCESKQNMGCTWDQAAADAAATAAAAAAGFSSAADEAAFERMLPTIRELNLANLWCPVARLEDAEAETYEIIGDKIFEIPPDPPALPVGALEKIRNGRTTKGCYFKVTDFPEYVNKVGKEYSDPNQCFKWITGIDKDGVVNSNKTMSCETNFCPECTLAHVCDKTCAYCPESPNVSTQKITYNDCPNVTNKMDALPTSKQISEVESGQIEPLGPGSCSVLLNNTHFNSDNGVHAIDGIAVSLENKRYGVGTEQQQELDTEMEQSVMGHIDCSLFAPDYTLDPQTITNFQEQFGITPDETIFQHQCDKQCGFCPDDGTAPEGWGIDPKGYNASGAKASNVLPDGWTQKIDSSNNPQADQVLGLAPGQTRFYYSNPNATGCDYYQQNCVSAQPGEGENTTTFYPPRGCTVVNSVLQCYLDDPDWVLASALDQPPADGYGPIKCNSYIEDDIYSDSRLFSGETLCTDPMKNKEGGTRKSGQEGAPLDLTCGAAASEAVLTGGSTGGDPYYCNGGDSGYNWRQHSPDGSGWACYDGNTLYQNDLGFYETPDPADWCDNNLNDPCCTDVCKGAKTKSDTLQSNNIGVKFRGRRFCETDFDEYGNSGTDRCKVSCPPPPPEVKDNTPVSDKDIIDKYY